MSINQVETVAILFPNDEWSGTHLDAQQVAVQQLRPNISFAQKSSDNLQTLSTLNADYDGQISGFLYVPDLDKTDGCFNLSKEYVPANVTRQANLPPDDFTLIAIAPWISAECTQSYMAASVFDPVRAFLFYIPNATATDTPAASSSAWDLGDGGAWKSQYQSPVYAIPGSLGFTLMHQLSLYSGNMTDVPFGHQISELPGIDPRDYVRLYTQLSVSWTPGGLPSLWVFLVIVSAVLIFILAFTSGAMHFVQSKRRKDLRRRVESGDVNLEALGIKQLTVPAEFIERLPLFTYNGESEKSFPISPRVQSTSSLGHANTKEASSKVSHRESQSTTTTAQCVAIRDDSICNTDSIIVHKFLPYSQPTCAICLEDFESGVTQIRELLCGHIFHPECIDTFLANNSSLCPMCKKSALPVGYCPVKITNAMVWRERNIRRLRPRITIPQEASDVEAQGNRGSFLGLGRNLRKRLFGGPQSAPGENYQLAMQPQPVSMTTALPARAEGEQEGERSRQELVEQRIRELAASQVPIRDPDVALDRQVPRWRRSLKRAFPGF